MRHQLIAHPLRRAADCIGAVVAAGLVIVLSASGAGAVVPPLGQLLNAGTGLWRLSPESGTASSSSITLPSLSKPATVSFTASGMTSITAGTDQDLFRLMGYTQARFRLVQMDLERRQALGQLSAVVGRSALSSDTFELDLGLGRAAERDWAQLAPNDPARRALVSYSQGVNAAITQLEHAHQLPTVFKALGYQPQPWTPVDSLAIQRLMTQTLSFSDAPLTFSYASRAVPASVFNAWFPTISENPQVPWDPGPYQKLPLSPLPVMADPGPASPGTVASDGTSASGGVADSATASSRAMGQLDAAVGPLEERLAALPANAMHTIGNSNAWVIAGSRTQSGQPILSGDPHLQLTLPSDWFQMEATSPSYHFTGVTLPGIPAPLMGSTDSFSWTVTNAQRPVTLFYLDKTSKSRPGQYFRDGTWRRMSTLKYEIQVKGEGTVEHTVRFTAEGPVLSMQGVTASVWYAGALPTSGLDSILQLLHAHNFGQFRDSLRGWETPALNFFYAGKNGQIGGLSPGAAPQVPGHNLALPLPGDGSADVTGSIPFAALPSAYDPPDGYLVAANNTEVTAAYPYQFSTSYDYADPGYRATEITAHLAAPGKWTLAKTEQLQTNVQDALAQELMPYLLKALANAPLTAQQEKFAQSLRGWNDAMDAASTQATFFQKFIVKLVYVTIEPWWQHYNIPQDPLQELALDPDSGSFASSIMYGDMVAWLKQGPSSKFFALPDGTKRSPTSLLRTAFTDAMAALTKKDGPNVAKWQYGQHNTRLFPSLLNVDSFNVGPFPASGDGRTINAGVPVTSNQATGGSVLVTSNSNAAPLDVLTTGASYRFDIDWGTGKSASVLPGGASEDPLSPWYSNGIPVWMKGRFQAIRQGPATTASIQWRFTP
jgi:penicillin G amidase